MHRVLYGHHIGAKMCFCFTEGFIKICIVFIQLVHHKNGGCFKSIGVFPNNIGTHFHTHGCIQQHYTSICNPQGAYHFACKVIITGRINNIYFIALPGGMKQRSKNRTLPFCFQFVIITHCIFCSNRTAAAGNACFKYHALGHGCFAAAGMAKQRNIFNVIGIVRSHTYFF